MINAQIFDDADAVVNHLADAMQALSAQDRAVHISLSGGSTPKMLFKRLASDDYANAIQWQNLHFWWGDERCVAPDDAESNFGEANKLLFSHIRIPEENIHRIRGEEAPDIEAARFSAEMQALIPSENGTPVFDWILLGVGGDGHTASLFPHDPQYDNTALALVASHPESGQKRVSKTARVLRAAKKISYLVLGEGKQAIVHEIATHEPTQLPYPAANIRSAKGTTEWVLDAAAAKKLPEQN